MDWREFYKDFYYAGIDAIEYEKQHTLRIARMGFEDNTENEDYNSLIFDVLAKDFYRQFDISEDSKGEKPYQPTADVVPKSEVADLQDALKCEKETNKHLGAEYIALMKENEKLTINMNAYGLAAKRIAEEKADVAREIFAELQTKAPWFCENQTAYEHFNEELAELEKKYIGESDVKRDTV